jgi:putative sterol carrier protein
VDEAESAREFFERLRARSERGSERTRGLRATYRFEVDGAGSWLVRIDDGAVSVAESDAAADCVIEASEDVFLRIANGALNPMGAFLTGKVRVTGDVALAVRLRDLFAQR